MGFYLRKSIRVGPLRFNLSKSGIGVSTGITGLRFGTGPKGNYVHMGRNGLYFRKTFSSKPDSRRQHRKESKAMPDAIQSHNLAGVEDFREIESTDASKMVDSSSKELLNELNAKGKKLKLFPAVCILLLIALVYLYNAGASQSGLIVGAVFGLSILGLAKYRDIMAKTVVILYDLKDEAMEAYSKLYDAFEQLASCSKSWHIEASGKVTDSKYHAGATGVVTRKPVTLSKGEIPFIKTNIDIPKIPVGKQFLAFMPDRLLVFEPNAVGAVSYQDLHVQIDEQPFVEEDVLPSDARVIDHTWKYVNKKGGPDKRFKDNRQIPVAMYEKLHFESSTGLNELIQISRTEVAGPFRSAIHELGRINQTIRKGIPSRTPRKHNVSDLKPDLFKEGIEAFKSGDCAKAISAFNEVIAMNPSHQLAYYNRGCAYSKTGDKKHALEDLKIAAQLGHDKSKEILKGKGISWS